MLEYREDKQRGQRASVLELFRILLHVGQTSIIKTRVSSWRNMTKQDGPAPWIWKFFGSLLLDLYQIRGMDVE